MRAPLPRSLRGAGLWLAYAAAGILTFVLVLASCVGDEGKSIRVAEQFGLAYAPLTIMKEYGLLEEALPDYEVSWSRLTNAASIREAMLADRLDLGFMGIPPFLIGADQGMEWQIFAALSEVPVGLVVMDPELSSLQALSTTDARIALPQPGSIQHILLAMEAERRFGAADFFDEQLVTLSHPDAFQALISGSGVDAHFATPPYLLDLLSDYGGYLLLDGSEAFGGDFTFAVGVGLSDYLQEHPEVVAAFQDSLAKAVALLREEEAVSRLAAVYGEDSQWLSAQLGQQQLHFDRPLAGVERFSAFMEDVGYLDRDIADRQPLLFSPAEDEGR